MKEIEEKQGVRTRRGKKGKGRREKQKEESIHLKRGEPVLLEGL